ncbi:FAD-binding protein [Ensifer canadensis]
MWHYTEGLKNFDPIWPDHGIRILPGPSSFWCDADGNRFCRAGHARLRYARHLAGHPRQRPRLQLVHPDAGRSSRRSLPFPVPNRTLI